MLAHQLHAGPVGPDLQLVSCGSTEGIRRAKQDPLALLGQLIRQLADGGGLAHAVDADHQDHGRLGIQLQRGASLVQHLRQNVQQRAVDRFFIPELLGADPLPQGLHGLDCGIHAHIRKDHPFFQLVVEFIIHAAEGGKDIADAFLRLGKTFFYLFEKSHI